MNENNLNEPSETNWTKLASMTDEEIDTSDIAPLGDDFFADAELRLPKGKVSVLVSVDEDVSDWYEAQGDEARNLMSAALRIYAEAHKQIDR
jgi:uncharacterized protein (DUF4415 family)